MVDKPTVCVDFDGVLNTYDRWRGEDELFEPRAGVADFLANLAQDYVVVIHSVRGADRIRDWLQRHNLHNYVYTVTREKLIAAAYIDDRAICFRGDYQDTLAALAVFRPFWQKGD